VTIQRPTRKDIIKRDFPELVGVGITISDAVKKYGIPKNTLINWHKKGYTKTIKSGYGMEIDEADVAYCSRVYNERQAKGIIGGVPLLDENGLPYKLKHPKLSSYRRRKKKELA